MTPLRCVEICKENGYIYAGLEYRCVRSLFIYVIEMQTRLTTRTFSGAPSEIFGVILPPKPCEYTKFLTKICKNN